MIITNAIITNAIVTAYCACTICCGTSGGTKLTASGAIAQANHTIAASRNIPFGSIVIINNRRYIVQDRLAKKYDNRFDIFMSSHEMAKKFGKQTTKVIVCEK